MPDGRTILEAIEYLYKNPMAVFIVLSCVFGYLYFEQNNELRELATEVGGLRSEQEKMHEIIMLKTKLAETECKVPVSEKLYAEPNS